uniref:Dual specificity phosphatase n=1 Tax=Wuchereria bancrofti TaxID=6293 RepID=A0A1I8F0I3_WUCBA
MLHTFHCLNCPREFIVLFDVKIAAKIKNVGKTRNYSPSLPINKDSLHSESKKNNFGFSNLFATFQVFSQSLLKRKDVDKKNSQRHPKSRKIIITFLDKRQKVKIHWNGQIKTTKTVSKIRKLDEGQRAMRAFLVAEFMLDVIRQTWWVCDKSFLCSKNQSTKYLKLRSMAPFPLKICFFKSDRRHINERLRIMQAVSYQVNPEYAKLSQIVPGLFICGISELNRHNVERNGITMIINATNEVPNLKTLGNILRIKLWIDDTPETDIYLHLEAVSDQIETVIADGGAVLVHCVAGVSRSATICLAFLTKYRCQSLRNAYFLMVSKRPLVRPNIGFWRQLIQFEQEIKHAPASVRMVYDEAQADHLLPDVYLEQTVRPDLSSIAWWS